MTTADKSKVYSERLDGLGDWLRDEMGRWQIPGLSVGIIADGEVIFADGFGQRDVEKDLPVDIDTIFAIGSCSKAFTTFDMGLLVDEGKLDWDTPLREYLPDFRLYDPLASEHATPRDIVSHRVGLPRHDFAWYGSTATREELYAALRYLPPTKSFRQLFQYQNLMYMTAGVLVERVSGQSWEAFTRERVLQPLGMTTSQFSVEDSKKMENAALPYDRKDGQNVAIPYRNIDAIGPAGSINSNIREMLNWLMMQMNGGQHDGKTLINAATLREMHTPQTIMSITPDMPWYGHTEIAHTTYGLGWAIQSYRGQTMIRHTGGIDGFISLVSFFPNEGVGAVILTNTGGLFGPTAIALRLFDTLFGWDALPWSDRLKAHQNKLEARGKASKDEAIKARKPDTSTAHALADYAGTYVHPAYGTFDITYDGSGLRGAFHGIPFTLTHHHYDTFEVMGEEADLFTLLSITTDAGGNVAQLSVTLEPAAQPVVFQRQPAEETT